MVDDLWEDIPSDNNEWEDVPTASTPEYSGWSDVPSSVAANTWGGLKNTVGGALSAAEDLGRYLFTPDDPMSQFFLKATGADKQIEQLGIGDDLVNSAKTTLEEANQRYQFEPWSGSSIANRVGSGVGQMAPIVVTGALTGGAGVVPLIGAQSFGTNYGNAQAEGQSSADSAYRGVGNALVDMAFGRANTNAWFKPNLGTSRKVAESVFTNVLTDPFQNIGNQRINEATGAQHVSVDDMNLGESMFSAGITGAVLPIGTDFAMRQQAKFQDAQAQKTIDGIRAQMEGLDQAVDSKIPLPAEDVSASQLLSDSAQVAPDNLPRIIDINPEEPASGIIPVESSARTPEFQAELQAAAKPQTQLIVDAQGRPLNAPPKEPASIVAPFTAKGNVRAALPTDEKAVIKELKLAETQRKNLEAKALPAVVEPKPAQSLSTIKAINNSSFPKVMEYVQKSMSDKGAQEGYINALKLEREANSARVPDEVYEAKIISDLAKSEFPDSEIPIDPKQVSRIEQLKKEAKATPGVVIPIMARPSLGEALPTYITHGPLSDVAINPELFQLRHGVAGKYGTKRSNKIHGQWDDGRSGIFMVFEPEDANKARVSLGLKEVTFEGHHRYEGAKERNVKNITKMVFKESDGWTIEKVKLYGAETNLSQGGTSIIDAAYIYRYAKEHYGQEGVDKIKQSIGADKHRTGRIIGLHAEPRLWNEFQKGDGENGVIKPNIAKAIAETAPGNKEAQDIGVDLALEKKVSEYVIIDEMKRFLSNDIKDEEYGKILNQVLAKRRAAAEGKVKLLDTLKKEMDGDVTTEQVVSVYGPDYLDRKPELVASLKEALEENKRFQKSTWRDDPDLAASIRKEVQPIYDAYLAQKEAADTQETLLDIFAPKKPPTPEEKAAEATNLQKLKDNIKGQRGWVSNPFGKNSKEDVLTAIRNLDDKELQKVFTKFGKNVDTQIQTVRKLGIEKTLENYFYRTIISPQSVTEAEPKFSPFMDTAKRGREIMMTVAHDLGKKATEFIKQPAQGRMWEFAAAAREAGTKFQWTAENFQKLGATDGEIKGLTALRDTMDSALPIYRDILIREGMSPELAQAKVDEMKRANYVPFSRFGDKFIQLNDPKTGEQVYFAKYETDKQMNDTLKRIEEIKKQSPGKNLQIVYGDFGQNPDSLFGSDSPNGFNQHLKKSFNVPGYQKNMKRAVAEYISSLSNFAAKSEMKIGFDEAFKNLPENSPQLAKYAQEYAQYQLSNEGEAALARKVMTLSFLAGRISSAAINLTQQLTTTLPRAQAEVGTAKALQYWGNSRKLLMERLIGGEARFAKNYPELNEAINTALKHGSISEQSLRELSGRARSASGEVSGFDKVMDYGMIFFDAAEKSNRYHAFLTGYQIAKDRGMDSAAATKYGERFTDTTQFDYSKINRPAFARGKIGAPLTTFQLFKYNQIKFTKDLISASLKGDTKAMQGLATNVGMMVALAGLGNAFIGSKELNKTLEANGIDGRQALREKLKDHKFLSDLLDNGLTYAFGLPDMSGSLSNEVLSIPGEYSPEGVPAMVGKALGGVPLAMGMKAFDAARLFSQGEYMKAFQAGAPSAMSGMAKAFEAASEGKITNTRNQTTVEDPTSLELLSMAGGFTPARVRDFYNRSRSAQLMADSEMDNGGINEKIAKARIAKDRVLEQSLRAENREANELKKHKSFPDPQAINQFIKSIQNPIEGQISRMPKDIQAEARRKFGKPSLGSNR